MANVKHALSPTLTLSFRPQIHSFFIRHHFTCHFSTLIDCISRNKCGLLYIGETGSSLGVRLGEHRRSVNNHDNTKPVARHFTLGIHCVSDIEIWALWAISGTKIAVNDTKCVSSTDFAPFMLLAQMKDYLGHFPLSIMWLTHFFVFIKADWNAFLLPDQAPLIAG